MKQLHYILTNFTYTTKNKYVYFIARVKQFVGCFFFQLPHFHPNNQVVAVQQHYVKPQPSETTETVLTEECKTETGLNEEAVKHSQPLEHILDEVSSIYNQSLHPPPTNTLTSWFTYISYQTPPFIYLTTVEYPLIGVYFIVGQPFMLIFTTKSPMHVYPRDPLRVYFIFVCSPSSELNIAMCFYYS